MKIQSVGESLAYWKELGIVYLKQGSYGANLAHVQMARYRIRTWLSNGHSTIHFRQIRQNFVDFKRWTPRPDDRAHTSSSAKHSVGLGTAGFSHENLACLFSYLCRSSWRKLVCDLDVAY